MASFSITAQDVQAMVNHWLHTPIYFYLGSDYGSDCYQLLQKPMRTGIPDKFIRKMRKDIPILSLLPEGSINILQADVGIDRKRIMIQVSGQTFVIPGSP